MAQLVSTVDVSGDAGLSIELLKRQTEVTEVQLDSRVDEADLPELASCFDNTEDYVEKFQLSPGQQTDVRTQAFVNGIQAGMKVALKYWRSRNPVEATFRTLLLILLSLLKGDVAVRVCKYLSDKYSTLCPTSQERNSRLSSYRDYLKRRYIIKETSTSCQWPPLPTTQVFKLAMIKREKIQRGRIDDDFVRLSITGKVDDILQHKTPVEIAQIFSECSGKRKFVLIEGAPGSGKSTLALHICQQWAENELFEEYDVVVLVRLRDPFIKEAKSIEDLLPCRNSRMAEEVGADMIATDGRGVLWVLDGWDELPSDLPTDSIINKLIQPNICRESPLLESAMLVTSRSTSSGDLHPLVSSRVEVLGFTPSELEQYFSECLKGDSKTVETLLERIRENPVVEGSCYLPLNASIVAHVFLSSSLTLPTSNHEIFTSVIRFSLSRYLQDRLQIPLEKAAIRTLNDLPKSLRSIFLQLCKLAYYGVTESKVTFTSDDLDSAGVSVGVRDIGLLQSVSSVLVDSRSTYYNFVHLSIQELLAAIHISHFSASEQMSVFNELFGNPRFSAVFEFYAGITKLKTCRPFLSLLPKFVFPNTPRGMLDLVSKIVQSGNRSQIVSLLHCVYEAGDTSLCEFLDNILNHSLNLGNTTLNSLDCLSVGYFLSVVSTTVSGVFTVYLGYCSIGDQGCKFLVRGLRKCLNTHSKITSTLILNLYNNDIHEEGVHHIAQLLKDTSVVRVLDLSYNEIGDSGLKSLCDALSTNTTLERLDIRYCEININDKNGPSLCQLLSTNTSPIHLNLDGNRVTDCRHIAAVLSNNKTLKSLSLIHCGLSDKSVEDLSTGLNNYIKKLHICGNDSITMNGLKILASRLTTLSRLNELWIPKHLESSIKTVFSEVNEERRRNGLPEIRVTALIW